MKKKLGLVLVLVLIVSAFVFAENVALLADVESDSNFPSYNPSVVADGERNEASEVGRWGEVAWASAETPDDHWLELLLPNKTKVKSIYIWWARDTGVFHYSEDIIIEANGKIVYDSTKKTNALVKDVKRLTGDADGFQVTQIFFNEPVTADTVRIIQLAGGGHPDRPNLMWVAEVEINE